MPLEATGTGATGPDGETAGEGAARQSSSESARDRLLPWAWPLPPARLAPPMPALARSRGAGPRRPRKPGQEGDALLKERRGHAFALRRQRADRRQMDGCLSQNGYGLNILIYEYMNI